MVVRVMGAPINTKHSYREAVAGVNTTTVRQTEKIQTFPTAKQKRRLSDEEYRAGIQAIPSDPETYHK
ncbi:hypothetical protein A2U01_0030636, partial [Trifolium medium]|nr:hypothetical protein [Trifolium medium]